MFHAPSFSQARSYRHLLFFPQYYIFKWHVPAFLHLRLQGFRRENDASLSFFHPRSHKSRRRNREGVLASRFITGWYNKKVFQSSETIMFISTQRSNAHTRARVITGCPSSRRASVRSSIQPSSNVFGWKRVFGGTCTSLRPNQVCPEYHTQVPSSSRGAFPPSQPSRKTPKENFAISANSYEQRQAGACRKCNYKGFALLFKLNFY